MILDYEIVSRSGVAPMAQKDLKFDPHNREKFKMMLEFQLGPCFESFLVKFDQKGGL